MKLFGGAKCWVLKPWLAENIDFIKNYVEQERLIVEASDLGGEEPRKVIFEL
ncbi:hypothetical protein [Vibrio qinghaiensis]|uniref:hypothetical protein n=1 Tax=Vibrio qinghaiensis TaxID=2025808 RepID=UPI001FC98E34|nr:hypothetical protein [Vibrio qinghaiensis]